MNVREWIRNKIEKTEAITREDLYKLYDLACEELGIEINYETYTRTIRKLLPLETNNNTPNKYEETTTCIKAERIFTRKPQTLEEVTEMFQINSKLWQCVKFSVSSWDVTSTRVGKTATNYSVKAEFKRREDVINYEELKEKFINDVKEYIPSTFNSKFKNNKNVTLLEIDIFDLHFGKLAWGAETGEDYDHKIARERFLSAISDILNKASHTRIDKILFIIGQDLFNFDNTANETTGGTRQDADVRWQKMFDKGVALLIEGIDLMVKTAPVDLMWFKGNHDTQTSFYATLYIDAWYRNNPDVDVNTSPSSRKYYIWGNSLIGFTHGNKEKKRLSGIMQVEQPKNWGLTKYREWHVGHRHSEHAVEENGVIIRSISSITGTDAWHKDEGYVGAIKKAQAFLWDYEYGLISIINSVIL